MWPLSVSSSQTRNSQTRNNFPTYAVLYTNTELNHPGLIKLMEQINSEPELKAVIHILNVSDVEMRSWMIYNQSGVKITEFPILIVREPLSLYPELYGLEYIDIFAQHARDYYNRMKAIISTID
jgi:hypothetical protein